ncbi:MAG: polysaccharide deacetylase family protein [Ruminococcus sp.]|nr:polysaccharide deacetylase family protein [Ruminococcus sp.]
MKKSSIPLAVITAALLIFSGCTAVSSKNDSSGSSAETTSASTTVTEPESIQRRIYDYDPDKPVIALTFDDGPNLVTTPQVLAMLEKYDAVGSFFLIGSNITEENSSIVRKAYEMGCDIENHSLTHQNFTSATVSDFTAEVEETDKLITDIIGETPRFFRAPYLAANTDMYENTDKCFISGFGCNDWDPAVTVEQRIDSVLDQAADGAIILLHDAQGNQSTVEALDTIIPELQKQGYQLVTISQLFEAKGTDPSDEIYKYRQLSSVFY